MAKAFDIPLKDGVELAAIRLRRTNTLIGTAQMTAKMSSRQCDTHFARSTANGLFRTIDC
jgi:hypothetical protein